MASSPRRRPPGVVAIRRRAAARRDLLIAVLEAMRPEEHLADARDAALLLIGWKAALRTDDLARLQMSDLRAGPEGLSVHLARSKTDQAGRGTTVGIAAPTVRASDSEIAADHAADNAADNAVGERALLDAGAAWARWRDRLGAHGVLEGPA